MHDKTACPAPDRGYALQGRPNTTLSLRTRYVPVCDENGEIRHMLVRREAGDQPAGPVPPGNYMRLTVSDTGGGMDEATLERVFDPYFTTKKQGEGTGLGLATVHGIVENHGGVIAVKSALNEGTTFDIYFPRVEATFSAVLTGWGETGPTSVAARILLVDDEEMLVRLGKSILKKLGHTVTAFGNSQDALDCFRQAPQAFDLLLTDQMMPGLTGLELTKQCLALRPDLPVILATGYSEATSKEEALTQGIRAILWKPVTINTMAETIQQALGEKGPQAQASLPTKPRPPGRAEPPAACPS